MNDEQTAVLTCYDLVREFKQGPDTLRVVNQVSLTIQPGEQVAIVGSSGSGKTTLLHLLGGLDRPTSGSILLQQHPFHQLNEKKRCQLRNQSLGFVYQFHHLLPEFTALENVAMPLLIGKQPYKTAIEKAKTLLDAVGLSKRYRHKMAQLSGGERQRVAIARALVNNPACVLADEPTGNLDSHTANRVYDLMQQLHRDNGTAFVLVTHDHNLAKRMDTIYTLDNGELI